MPRAFLAAAVPPLPALLRALGTLRDLGPAVRPVAPENLHITLRFLGETPAQSLPAIASAVRTAAADAAHPVEAQSSDFCYSLSLRQNVKTCAAALMASAFVGSKGSSINSTVTMNQPTPPNTAQSRSLTSCKSPNHLETHTRTNGAMPTSNRLKTSRRPCHLL